MLSNYLMKRVTKLTGSDECRVPFPTHPKSDVQKCYILEEAGVEVEILNENILHSLCYHSTEKLVWRAEKKFHFPHLIILSRRQFKTWFPQRSCEI